MATANVVIRCSDPDSIIAQLPSNLRDLAKVHHFDKGYAKRRYHEDPSSRRTGITCDKNVKDIKK